MHRRVVLQSLLTPASLLLPRLARADSYGVTLAVVVAKDSAWVDVSLATLFRIFTGEPEADPSRQRVVPLNHPPRSTDRVGFDGLVLGMDADNVAKFWLDRRIRGRPGAPRTVESLGILLKLVARLPGAMGYVRPQFVNDTVRTLKVGGVLPGGTGYPLVFVAR